MSSRGRFPIFSQGLNYGTKVDRFFTTRKRRELVEFLVRRQGLGDRLRLASLDLNGFDGAFGICNFGFELWRVIGDGPRRLFGGKGATDESTGAVAVWNVGGELRK